jgi:hypothetical protein
MNDSLFQNKCSVIILPPFQYLTVVIESLNFLTATFFITVFYFAVDIKDHKS